MTPTLIGITGKRGSGKNTVADYIKEWAEERGQKAQLQGFADSLKLSFARLFHPHATVEEAIEFADYFKESGTLSLGSALPASFINRYQPEISGRAALQRYGTECHREVFDTNFWVDALLPDSHHYHPEPGLGNRVWDWPSNWNDGIDYAIVTDARFDNEAERVIQLEGVVWQVHRASLDEQSDAHASEKGLDPHLIYVTIDNNTSLSDLKGAVYNRLDMDYGKAWPHDGDFVNKELVSV